MDILKIISEWLSNIARSLPWLRPVLVALRWIRLNLFEILRDQPWVFAIGLIVLAVVAFFHPALLPDFVKPAHTCSYLKLGSHEAGTNTGDDIEFGTKRDCEDRKLIAVESFNYSDGYVPQDASKAEDKIVPNLVSAGLLYRQRVERSDRPKDDWQEYDVFHNADDFQWKAQTEDYSNRFKGQTCTEDVTPGEKDKTIRIGFTLLSKQARSSHLLPRKVWERCNSGKPEYVGNTHFPQFSDCKYERFELFIPAIEPSLFWGIIRLTYQTQDVDMTSDRPAQEKLEIEITPKMIEGAKDALRVYFFEPIVESEVCPYEVLRDLLDAQVCSEK